MKFFVLSLFFSIWSYSNDEFSLKSYYSSNIEPLKDITLLINPVKENVLKLKDVKIAIADYGLIKRDFPHLEKLSNPQIDEWLIKTVGYMAETQTQQEITNDKINTEKKWKKALRPSGYGRALVYKVMAKGKKLGLIDVKGAGAKKPRLESHGDGLMTLGESLREFSYEKMVSAIINHSGVDLKVVGSYAVLSLGFNVKHADGKTSPAGLYLRQAHSRDSSFVSRRLLTRKGWSSFPDLQIEKTLNLYGIYTGESTNVQYGTTLELYDFGHYVVTNKEINGVKPILPLPQSSWGFQKRDDISFGDWLYSKYDNPWIWGHETAESFVQGKATRHHVWLNHFNLLKPVEDLLGNSSSLEVAKKLKEWRVPLRCSSYLVR